MKAYVMLLIIVQWLTDGFPGPEKSSMKENSHAESESMPTTAPVVGKKENATREIRIEVLDWYHANGENQSKTARYFDKKYPNLCMKQPLVSAWVKNESKIREDWEKNGLTNPAAKRVRQTQHPDVTEMMDLWVAKVMHNRVQLTGEVLRQKWKQFADMVGVPDDERLSLSDGWLRCFKERHGLKEWRRHGESGSASQLTVEQERERIQKLISDGGYHPRDVFNMDKTGLFYVFVPFHSQIQSNSK